MYLITVSVRLVLGLVGTFELRMRIRKEAKRNPRRVGSPTN
jgi:hypothetical protein